MRRHPWALPALLVLATVALAVPASALEARLSIPEGMCSLWTTKQASSAMKEQMKVVREDPDYCVWYSKKPHNGNISTLSASLWGGDASSDLPLLDQARGQAWRDWTSEDAVAGVPVLLTDVRRFGKNREITAAAFPDDVTWLDLNATSVIGTNVRTAVKRMVELAAPAFAVEPVASASASGGPVPDASVAPPSGGACSLLTVDEISEAAGEAMQLGGDYPGQCIFSAESGSLFQVIVLTAGPDDTTSMLDQRQERSPDASAAEVGGYPALFEIGPLLGVPSVYVYPSSAVELELEYATTREVDAQAVLTGLAEIAVGRLVAAGLPVPPAPVPTLEPGTALCSVLSTEEASAAVGGAPIAQARSEADGCAYLGDGSDIAVLLEILRDDRAAEMHASIAQLADRFELAGMPGGQTDMPPGSIVVLLPDDTTAIQLTVFAPEGTDVHATTRALAEVVAPRARTYLGLP